MSEQLNYDGIEQMPLHEYTEKAYLDYSMYVILDRALPQIGDGLKPVQRRIVYAMSELGLRSGSKFKKSARTVGDVLGKYHPHGDSACYEAMVLMAQPFAYRYPLVDGQGNWGSPDDPKSFAAMRYTESRLTAYAQSLLSELGQGTVDWQLNFDGTLEEPEILPARLPNVLLNGGSGIAVGMATDIPPHNMREIVSACIRLLEDRKATLSDLMEHVKGPDFPTNAEIISSSEEIQQIYETGTGSLRMRATWEREKSENQIVITALPHQTSGSKIMEQIAAQMRAKKLPMVDDLRDESTHENPTRLVIIPRSNRIDVHQMMSHLFASTDLERTYRVNMNIIGLDGRPGVMPLLKLLKDWLIFRERTVRRRLEFRLQKVLDRLHILDGLLIAFLNIDEVIAIIRSEDKPKPVLMQRFGITDSQAEAILELKLRHLAKLEEMKIRGEQEDLDKERQEIETLLSSTRRIRTLIRKELTADAEEYGDERRSPIVSRNPAVAMSEMDLVPSEPVTIVLSKRGWIRAGKGHDIDPTALNYKSGDGFRASAMGKSHLNSVFIDSTGRTYTLKNHSLPSARGQGEPLSGRINPPDGATFEGVICGQDNDLYLISTDFGYGFITKFSDMNSKNKAGKALLNVPAHAKVMPPLRINSLETDRIAAVTSEGHLLIIAVSELPLMAKGKGIKIINIPPKKLKAKEEQVLAIQVMGADDTLVVTAGKRHVKLKGADLEHFFAERGKRGMKLPRGLQRVDKLEVMHKK